MTRPNDIPEPALGVPAAGREDANHVTGLPADTESQVIQYGAVSASGDPTTSLAGAERDADRHFNSDHPANHNFARIPVLGEVR